MSGKFLIPVANHHLMAKLRNANANESSSIHRSHKQFGGTFFVKEETYKEFHFHEKVKAGKY